MKENLIHARTCVYNINYHVVWSVKYRRKILTREVEEYLKTLVFQIAEDKGFTVHLFETGEGDHVHCFVSAPPKMSVTNIVKYLKGITGRKLFVRFPEIRGKLWKGEGLEQYPDWYYQKSAHKEDLWYKSLPSQTAQEVLKQLDKSWKSFYVLKESGGIKNPHPPYFKKEGMAVTYMQMGIVHRKGAEEVRLSISRKLKGHTSGRIREL